TAFLEATKSVEKTVSAIMPTSSFCEIDAPTSALVATLNDMLAVDAGFKRITGVPDKIIGKLKKATARIAEIQGGGSKIAGLKADMTEKLSKGLADKLDTLQ